LLALWAQFDVMLAKWLRTLQLSVKSLLLHPMRSALTVLGIFIGVSSVIWLLAIGEGISRASQKQIESLGARNILVRTIKPTTDDFRDGGYGLTRADYLRLVSTIPQVDVALPIRVLEGEFRNKTRRIQGRIVATTPEYAPVTQLTLDRKYDTDERKSRFLTDADMDGNRNYCVLASKVAEQLFPYGNPLGQDVLVEDIFYEVVGVMQFRSPSAGIGGSQAAEDFSHDIYIPITTLWWRIGDQVVTQKPGSFSRDIVEVSQITLRVKEDDATDEEANVLAVADLVRETIGQYHTLSDFVITVPLELLQQARTTRLMFILFLGLIAAISLVVGGIGIMNIMLATVTERTREIGIRRAIGAKRRDITSQFLVESVVLSLAGGALGVAGGLLCRPLSIWIREGLKHFYPEQMTQLPQLIQEVEPQLVSWSIPLAFVISVAVGVLFGVYPAIRAALLDPIEALRHE
jgi:putative ABC transport system permease protein